MDRTNFLVKTSAIYALIGAFIGSHMAGSGGYVFQAIHAHILVVGWLTLFAFAIYYRVFTIPKNSKLAFLHVWTAFLGTFGLTSGMWLYYMAPINGMETFNMIYFIAGGSTLLVCFIIFAIMVFKQSKWIREE